MTRCRPESHLPSRRIARRRTRFSNFSDRQSNRYRATPIAVAAASGWRIRTHAATRSSYRPPQCFSQVKLRRVAGCDTTSPLTSVSVFPSGDASVWGCPPELHPGLPGTPPASSCRRPHSPWILVQFPNRHSPFAHFPSPHAAIERNAGHDPWHKNRSDPSCRGNSRIQMVESAD